MRNKIGYLYEGFFGNFDEDEYSEDIVNDIQEEITGVKVPTKLSDIDNYKYKFEFFFTGMRPSKIPAVNIKRFAVFKNWFMYAVDNCYLIDDYQEPIFHSYDGYYNTQYELTDEIKRFGDVLFNNSDYDINHRIFWNDTDPDKKKHKYGATTMKFTFAFNATCKKYSQVMNLLKTLCIIFEAGAKKAFNGKKKDGSTIHRCNPEYLRDIESNASISMWDIHDIARRTKKSYKTFAKWCEVLAGLKKSKEMMNFYNKTEIDNDQFVLFRYLNCQFDEIEKVYDEQKKTLTLLLHTSYSPNKNIEKLTKKTKSSGYDLKISVAQDDKRYNRRHITNVECIIDTQRDIDALCDMIKDDTENINALMITAKIREISKTKAKKSDTLDLSQLQKYCSQVTVDVRADFNYYQHTPADIPHIVVFDKFAGRKRELLVDCSQNSTWRSNTQYSNNNRVSWNNFTYKNYVN